MSAIGVGTDIKPKKADMAAFTFRSQREKSPGHKKSGAVRDR
jgi:hypothetical protein